MEELWQQASEMMTQRPVLWLPVLVADLLGFLVNIASAALVRYIVYSRVQYHSVLGGGATRVPLNAAAVQHVRTLALAIAWSSNLVRLLFYAAALVATAALVRGFRARADRPVAEIAPALGHHLTGIVSLALRAWALYAAAAFLMDLLGRWLLAHGHKAVLTGGWVETGAGLLLVALLALYLAPAAIHILAGHRPSPLVQRRGQILGFALAGVALLLGRFVENNLRSVNVAFLPARYVLGLTGSWIVALPYAVLFAGLGLLAWQTTRDTHTAVGTGVTVG